MRIGDNLEYDTLPPTLTWTAVREGVNRLRTKGYKPFPDGHFRVYLDAQGAHDLVHDPDFRGIKSLNTSVFIRENVLLMLTENTFINDPFIPTYLVVTNHSSAEVVGMPSSET